MPLEGLDVSFLYTNDYRYFSRTTYFDKVALVELLARTFSKLEHLQEISLA